MWLKKIDFSRWSEDRPLKGGVEFEGESGNITLSLTSDEILDLVKTLGAVLVRHTQSAAKRMELEASKATMLELPSA